MPGKNKYVIAIDAGTTSIRVVCFNRQLKKVDSAQEEFKQYYPQPGWVEHDAEEIWNVTKRLLDKVLRGRRAEVATIGITNQRETTVVWNAKTDKPVSRAIVWQCRRTAEMCEGLKKKGHEGLFIRRTGLKLDSYFSGTKIRWILDRHKGSTKNLKFGTIDSWLIWKLSGGCAHATDFTNASRTLLYNIKSKKWDAELAKILGVPMHILPEVQNSADFFGDYKGIPITGVVGDQQAAMVGQGAVKRGEAKNTYGTGCFLLMNIGQKFAKSKNGLLTTLTPDTRGKPMYALEGSVFIGGAVMQWLRDELGLIKSAREGAEIALATKDTAGVYIVPAFVGMGAPHWNSEARGIITGLTRGANKNHIITAAVESTAYQVHDLVKAMEMDSGVKIKELFVDGGAARDNFLLQLQSDLIRKPVVRPANLETTVTGAAVMAGVQVKFWDSAEQALSKQKIDRVFKPRMPQKQRQSKLEGWNSAVDKL